MTRLKTMAMAGRAPMPLSSALPVFVLLLALLLSACSTASDAISSAKEDASKGTAPPAATTENGEAAAGGEQLAEAPAEPKITHRDATVTQKGTNIRAIVNGQPITNYDIQRRAAFLNLRRVGGNRTEKALEELVDQAIKMQEAKRRGTNPSSKEVDEAFGNFAKSNKMSNSQMSQVLGQAGVGAEHFKEFIRGQMGWQRAVGIKLRSEAKGKTTQETMFEIRKSGGHKPETTEYLLEQTIFVIPANRSGDKAYQAQRRKDAEAFRAQFSACGETVKQAAGMRDVTVRQLPRILEPQLPPDWNDELISLSQGAVTKTKTTDKGVEFLAICSKKTVSDDNAAVIVSQSKQFEDLNEAGDKISQEYLAELKSKAQIVYR
ncbi:MAG: peptidylprolyl isomerase [Nitratireductor sp.]|nr:peptidylprolyl isomerase [Nitratireductor sp.]